MKIFSKSTRKSLFLSLKLSPLFPFCRILIIYNFFLQNILFLPFLIYSCIIIKSKFDQIINRQKQKNYHNYRKNMKKIPKKKSITRKIKIFENIKTLLEIPFVIITKELITWRKKNMIWNTLSKGRTSRYTENTFYFSTIQYN